MNLQWYADRFTHFAVHECKGSSELYRCLSEQIAEDDALLHLSRHTREGQPVPNMLFGAVHHLLLKGTDHRLKNFYPSIVEQPDKKNNPFPVFKDFCLANADAIQTILQNRLVQTNEVRRCAYLYPVFCWIYRQTHRPLSLVEIGTSAGLQLLWDHYAYSYNDSATIHGEQDAAVHLTANVREGSLPHHLLSPVPPVHSRLGMDLNVSDLTEDEDYVWLKALIWPEHDERRCTFEKAARELQKTPPPLIEGDGVTLLPEIIKDIPMETTVCIFHTHVANQMTVEIKNALIEHVEAIGRYRNVFHIYNNMDDGKLHVDSIMDGTGDYRTIGETDGHGRWFDWLL